MPWYVLYTKPNSELKTAALLEAKGIQVYCPVQKVVKQWSDRKKKVTEAVFPSFLFVQLEQYHQDKVTVLTTAGAVRFLWWLSQPAVVRDEEIAAIRTYLGTYSSVQLLDRQLWQTGKEITLHAGPFKGQKAVINTIRNNKAYLELPAFGWQLVADLPINSLSEL